jgi:hypothetical protein
LSDNQDVEGSQEDVQPALHIPEPLSITYRTSELLANPKGRIAYKSSDLVLHDRLFVKEKRGKSR